MAFTSALTSQVESINSGERGEFVNLILTTDLFEDELKRGRFAKWDTSRLDNMDGSASPEIAGVVLRSAVDAMDDGDTVDSALYEQVQYQRFGLVTVDVKSGETPTKHGRVYVSNAGDANDGMATATNTDVGVNAEFIREIKTGVWEIFLSPPQGDVDTHIADATAAHAAAAISVADAGDLLGTSDNVEDALAFVAAAGASLAGDLTNHLNDTIDAHDASAISLQDTAGYTSATQVEAAIAELYSQRGPLAVADPGDAAAIPVTRSASVALTTAGAETRTLAIPTFAGQRMDLCFDVDGGDCVITVASPINATGNNTITLDTAGQCLFLAAVQIAGVLAWRVTENVGSVALTTV